LISSNITNKRIIGFCFLYCHQLILVIAAFRLRTWSVISISRT